MAWTNEEFAEKLGRVRSLIQDDTRAILISSQASFLWLTGGRPYINTAGETACADLLVTPDAVYLIANNIEADRLTQEELTGLPIQKVDYHWWEPPGIQTILKQLGINKTVVTERELGSAFAKLRWKLTKEEQLRFQKSGQETAKVLETVAFHIKPGHTEQEIADCIKSTALQAGIQANVALMAADERAFLYRHPVPTGKKLQKYAMLVISGQKDGLYASASRLVHFGNPPQAIIDRHAAVLQVEAALISATIVGARLNEVFKQAILAYQKTGYPEEWTKHHQGGLAGYNSRESKADLVNAEIVAPNQAYAWNPTIAGVKSEDTFIIRDSGIQFVTAAVEYPVVEMETGYGLLKRPAILIR